MMAIRISQRDLEAISAYLDGQLSERERAHLEARLNRDPELRHSYEQLHRTRAVLRSLPPMRAPRNYVLTPQMVKARKSPPPSYPVLRLASVVATLLFVLVLAGDFLSAPVPVPAPMAVSQATEEVAVMEAPLREEAERAAAPAEEQPEADSQKTLPSADPQTATPAPAAAIEMLAATPEPTMEAMAPPSAGADLPQGADASVTAQAETVPSPAVPNILRILEVVFAVVALGTGLAAAYLRRGSGG